jgi:4-aminobutyrate aminotransferase and related aminotransferases
MLPELITEIPGPRSRACAAKLRAYESRGVTWMADDFPVFWERAEGSNVWDVDGNRFLDFTAAFAVSGLGHGAKPLRAAVVGQAEKLLHAMGDVHPGVLKAELCQALSAITFERWGAGPGKTYLGNSGSEAVEAALKTALLRTGKPGVLSFEGGYHGLGHGALETGGLAYFREPFVGQLGRFGVKIRYPRKDADLAGVEAQVRRAFQEHPIGCILVEPVQGRGGEVVPPMGFLPLLRRLCDDLGAVLVLDEIYTGFHRTGRFFACEHTGVVPDLICLGKALSGGFPLSACVGRAKVMDAWPVSRGEALHTSTTLGNPLGCALALASIAEHRKPETAEAARLVGSRLRQGLNTLKSPRIAEIRGLGAMLGVELVDAQGRPDGALTGAIMRRGLQDGLILLGGGPEGNVLSFSPPFTVTGDEIAFLVEKLQNYLDAPVGDSDGAVPLSSPDP